MTEINARVGKDESRQCLFELGEGQFFIQNGNAYLKLYTSPCDATKSLCLDLSNNIKRHHHSSESVHPCSKVNIQCFY